MTTFTAEQQIGVTINASYFEHDNNKASTTEKLIFPLLVLLGVFTLTLIVVLLGRLTVKVKDEPEDMRKLNSRSSSISLSDDGYDDSMKLQGLHIRADTADTATSSISPWDGNRRSTRTIGGSTKHRSESTKDKHRGRSVRIDDRNHTIISPTPSTGETIRASKKMSKTDL